MTAEQVSEISARSSGDASALAFKDDGRGGVSVILRADAEAGATALSALDAWRRLRRAANAPYAAFIRVDEHTAIEDLIQLTAIYERFIARYFETA